MLRICMTAIFFLCLTPNTWAGSEKGPLSVRNQFPPHLMFLKPVPDSPRLIPRTQFNFSLSADHASIFVNELSGEKWSALIDMEITVLELSLEYGLTDYLTLGLDLPFVSMNSGFLDGFLEDFHSTFGLPNYGKEERPKDEFAYRLQKQGKNWFRAESGDLCLADSAVSAKLSLMDEIRKEWFLPEKLSLSYTLKMPLGDEEGGFGSGGFDHEFSLLSQFRISPLVIYLNPSLIFLSDPETVEADISVSNILGLFLGGEYIFSESLSLLAQLNYYTSPFENTGISQLDTETLQAEFGFIYKLTSSLSLEFAFCEDLTRSAPDFNVHLRMSYGNL